MTKEGKVRCWGLSEAGVQTIRRAHAVPSRAPASLIVLWKILARQMFKLTTGEVRNPTPPFSIPRAGGGQALAVTTDVTVAEQVQALVDAAVAEYEYGRIDVMLNNAGLMPHSPLERLKLDDWNNMIDVNLRGVLHGIAAARPHMKAQKSGHFINVSSVAGHKVRPGSAVYAATKYAVRAVVLRAPARVSSSRPEKFL